MKHSSGLTENDLSKESETVGGTTTGFIRTLYKVGVLYERKRTTIQRI